MIQPDTTKMEKIIKTLENKHFQRVVSILVFIFAFICLIMIFSQMSYFISSNSQNNPTQNVAPNQNNTNSIQQPPPKDDFFRGMPKESPFMLIFYIMGFIISLLSGILINLNFYKKEKKELKSNVVNEMLLPEEKLLTQLLEENNGELTQKELVTRSGLNKLKVSRVIKRLESLNIIEKFPYGMTNNIKLKK